MFYRDWRSINAEYLLIGRVSVRRNDMRIEYDLFDVLRQTIVYSGVETGPVSDARMLGHRVADAVYEKLTGVPGAFATGCCTSPLPGCPGARIIRA